MEYPGRTKLIQTVYEKNKHMLKALSENHLDYFFFHTIFHSNDAEFRDAMLNDMKSLLEEEMPTEKFWLI